MSVEWKNRRKSLRRKKRRNRGSGRLKKQNSSNLDSKSRIPFSVGDPYSLEGRVEIVSRGWGCRLRCPSKRGRGMKIEDTWGWAGGGGPTVPVVILWVPSLDERQKEEE